MRRLRSDKGIFKKRIFFRINLETAMDGPRKALKRAKTYTCKEAQTHPQGECMISLEPFIFAAFRAFRGLQSRIQDKPPVIQT
jgi:hypothetical protein